MNLYSLELNNNDILSQKKFRWKVFCLDYDLLHRPLRRANRIKMNWKDEQFLKKNKGKIPSSQGIYMFVINIENTFFLNNASKYVLYVGQAENLQIRFEGYFKYKDSKIPSDFLKRCMVLIWEGKLDFYFFETNNVSTKILTEIEFDLIDSIVPPINQRFRGNILKESVKLYSPRA